MPLIHMSKSFRDTKQRNAIIDTLHQYGQPMTAKHIRDMASDIVPSLGIATVYRNIRHLLESGEIEQIDVPGFTSYFSLPRTRPQLLLVCRETQRVQFVDNKQLNISSLRNIPDGFEADRLEVFLFGRFNGDSGRFHDAGPVAAVPAIASEDSEYEAVDSVGSH